MLDFTLASTPEVCTELGQRLRAQRLLLGWTQADLAQRAGLSGGTIKNLEHKGQATLDSLVRVVTALGLLDDLAGLFAIKLDSIAAMEQAETVLRRRAPRRAAA